LFFDWEAVLFTMPQPLANREDILETAKKLMLQGVKTAAISEQTGVKPKTIRTWINRYGWNHLASRQREIASGHADTTLRDTREELSDRVKARIMSKLDALTADMKVGNVCTLKDLQTLTAIAKDTFGWSPQSPAQHLHLHDVSRLLAEQ